MGFPRTIIYIDKYVYTLDGNAYMTDDVTEDGMVYNGMWVQVFLSDSDLAIIKEYKRVEELNELVSYLSGIYI
jgi:hypothetical protein